MMRALNSMVIISSLIVSIWLNGLLPTMIISVLLLWFPVKYLLKDRYFNKYAKWSMLLINICFLQQAILWSFNDTSWMLGWGMFASMSAILYACINRTIDAEDKRYWNLMLSMTTSSTLLGYVIPMAYALLTYNGYWVSEIIYFPIWVVLINLGLLLSGSLIRAAWNKMKSAEIKK